MFSSGQTTCRGECCCSNRRCDDVAFVAALALGVVMIAGSGVELGVVAALVLEVVGCGVVELIAGSGLVLEVVCAGLVVEVVGSGLKYIFTYECVWVCTGDA